MAQKEEAAEAAASASQNGDDLKNLEDDPEKLKELIDLPPFEIVTGFNFQDPSVLIAVTKCLTRSNGRRVSLGWQFEETEPINQSREGMSQERLPVNFFKFQFRNVEYSSGRNKTFLCYVVEAQNKGGQVQASRGYLEDEHAGAHAEEAFFNTILPAFDPALKYNVTWYVSSSPCAACADRILKTLSKAKNLRLLILVCRLFMWEEPEVQAALKKLKEAGCKLRIMKPQDFEYIWQNFVEQEEGESKAFEPWEDIQENFLYYEEKLADILK